VSIVDQHHGLCQHIQVIRIVGDHHHRNIEHGLDTSELCAHAHAQQWIQGGKRFVQQQKSRSSDQGSRNGHPLTLPSGKKSGMAGGKVSDFEYVQCLVDPSAVGLVEPSEKIGFQAEGEVVKNRQVRKQGIVLEQVTDAACCHRTIRHLAPVEPGAAIHHDMALIRCHESRNGHERHAFSCSRRPEKYQPRIVRFELDVQFEFSLAGGEAFADIQVDATHDQGLSNPKVANTACPSLPRR